MFVLIDYGRQIVPKIAEILLERGKRVRILTCLSKKAYSSNINENEIEIVECDLHNSAEISFFLLNAESVLTTLPRDLRNDYLFQETSSVGAAIVQAIEKSNIKHVINLSSVGAHLSYGTGLILPYHWQEERLNRIEGINLLHIRPAYVFENFLRTIPQMRTMGIFTDLLHSEIPIFCITLDDIAAVACRELIEKPLFSQRRALHLRGCRMYTPSEICRVLTTIVNVSGIEHQRSDPKAVKSMMKKSGFSDYVICQLLEMYESFYMATFINEVIKGPTELTPTDIWGFSELFKRQYQSKSLI